MSASSRSMLVSLLLGFGVSACAMREPEATTASGEAPVTMSQADRYAAPPADLQTVDVPAEEVAVDESTAVESKSVALYDDATPKSAPVGAATVAAEPSSMPYPQAAGGATAAVASRESRTRAPSVPAKKEEAQKPRRDQVFAADAPAASVAPPPPPRQTVEAERMPVEPEPVVMDGNTYTDHGVNPFTLTSEDALSTFSIDVDTASYALARRQLKGNALPDQASVRVEEFVNYFDYDSYAQPDDNSPFAVHMEAMPDPFHAGRHTLRVGVQGKEVSRSERPAVHLTFLVDVSGSMSSADKLGLAKEAMHMMVDGLREDDTVALATYAGRTARVLSPTTALNKRKIHAAIEDLSSGGSTAMSAGIDIAYEMAWESFKDGHENRVVVLSDGDANVGNTSWDSMLSQIKGYADRGVTLSTIGLGMGNYRDTLMEQLSNKGDGNNFYIDSREQAQRVFVEELSGTMLTIARDTKIQVEFNPKAVQAYRLIGYENRDIADKDFRNDRVDAGEVGAGHNVTALYEVILKDDHAAELATVRMRWEAPGADKAAVERAWTFADRQMAETPSLASQDTRIAYAAATFAEVLRGSPHASELDMNALIRFTEQAARKGEKDDQELLSLMRIARDLGAGQRNTAVSAL